MFPRYNEIPEPFALRARESKYSHPLPLETPPPLETAVFFACFFNTTDFHTS